MKEWFVSELQEALGKSTHDVQMTLNYLATRGDLDMNRVGMFGQGSGGTIALLAAAADDRIRAVDVLDPRGLAGLASPIARRPGKERANYLKPEFLTRVAPLDPVRGGCLRLNPDHCASNWQSLIKARLKLPANAFEQHYQLLPRWLYTRMLRTTRPEP